MSDNNSVKKTPLTPEQKAERALATASLKAQKVALREEKRAAKAAASVPKHMAKLNTAKGKLLPLTGDSQKYFDQLVSNLPTESIETLSGHLSFHVREQRTKNAVNSTVKVGQPVKVTGGEDKRYVGQVGTVVKAQRIRCYVEVAGKQLYLFTSDVEPLAATSASEVENDMVEDLTQVAV